MTANRPRIGSLFSGYGGLDMAVAEVLDATVAWHVEYDTARSRILAHHWPDVPNYGDVATVDWTTVGPIDIFTGGYPCQPFSQAGQRKGTDDDRHLWPYVREAIRALRPRYTILENVAGHRTLGFDRVLGDMAEDGLNVRWTSIRASDVGAPHHRERLFIVATPADTDGVGCGQGARQSGTGTPQVAATVSGIGALPRDGRADDVLVLPTPTVGNATGTNERRGGARSDELLLPGVAVAASTGALLPTPRASEASQTMGAPSAARHVEAGNGGLTETIGVLLPTPTTSDSTGGKGPNSNRSGGDYLREVVAVLPSPIASDASGGGLHPDHPGRRSHDHQDH